jgi:hypothetical protein
MAPNINTPPASDTTIQNTMNKEHNIVPLPDDCVRQKCCMTPGGNTCICQGTKRRPGKKLKRFICLDWYVYCILFSFYFLIGE